MKLTTLREQLLKPLQHVIGAVERRQTLPILSNVLIIAKDKQLTLTATDLEVELSAETQLPSTDDGGITVSARKLLDILRSLPEEAAITLSVEPGKLVIFVGRSRFTLVTLPPSDFPVLEDVPFEGAIQLSPATLRKLIERTHFAMAQQDVRYYLNGMLLSLEGNRLCAVATDGHRLALCEAEVATENTLARQVIIPRKGVQELLRLLVSDGEEDAVLQIGTNHIRVVVAGIRFTSKLIDGKFPDYQRVIPYEGDKIVIVDRMALRNALNRAAILSNEKYRGVRLQLDNGVMRAQTHNPEQEEAEEELEVDYQGEVLEIGFNVNYLLDALGALTGELVKFSFSDANSSCLIQETEGQGCKYVVMPMRL